MSRVIVARSARVVMDELPPEERVALETHLDNISTSLTHRPGPTPTELFGAQVDGQYQTHSMRYVVHFTVDPSSGMIFVKKLVLNGAE